MSDTVVLGNDDIKRSLIRIAHEIVEANSGSEIALVGIHTRGVFLARRLQALVSEFSGSEVQLGELDISFYRDDLSRRGPEPVVHNTSLDFSLDDMSVVLVDDVLFTGRTARAAMDALFDYGRPSKVQLVVMVDRGHHELPVRPDYVGKNLPTAKDDRVNVKLSEHDSVDEISVAASGTPSGDGASASEGEPAQEGRDS